MKSRFTNWISVIIIAAVGIVFIIFNDSVNLLSWLVRAVGLLLLVPGLITLIGTLNDLNGKTTDNTKDTQTPKRSRATDRAVVIVSIADIIVALWMLIAPGFFEHLIVYLFAAALFIYGIYAFVNLIYFSRPVRMPWPFYIMPTLSIIGGLVLILTPIHTITSTMTLFTGIMLVVIAINTAFQIISYSRGYKALAIPESHRIEQTTHSDTAETSKTASNPDTK